MLICMIKHCYVLGSNDDLVDIYLLCVEAKAYNFYVTLGFKCINGKYDDGFQQLPIALQNSYKMEEEEGAVSGFHNFDSSDENIKGSQPMKLLELKSGSLWHFKETKCTVFEPAKSTKCWCEHPPPTLNEHVVQVGDDFLKKKLKNLPYMKWLLVPSPYECILPHSGCYLKGDMLLVNGVKPSEMKGCKWMASPEIDLMLLSTLLMDDCYQDFAFDVSAYHSHTITLAFKAYVCYSRAINLVQEKGNAAHSLIAKRILDKYKQVYTPRTF